jgi:hypothetical protein
VQENQVIKSVADLSELKSKLVDIEIIKFYKSLLKTKERYYLAQLVNRNRNLFAPIMTMFEETYHPKMPRMVQSCIRDLFDFIFNEQNHKNGGEYNYKLAEFLIKEDPISKAVLFNPRY